MNILLNKIILIGRLTRDPELRYTPNGTAVCNFSLAVERNFTNRDGEREVDFIDIVVWRRQAENCANHLAKGRLVAVEGRLQIRSYENSEGQKRRATEVVANNVQFLDWGNDNNNRSRNQSQSKQTQSKQSSAKQQNQVKQNTDDEDDIEVPF